MDIKLAISILEAIYLMYTFYFLKTSIDFNIFASSEHYLLKHEIGTKYTFRICKFGQIAIIPFIVLLLARNFIEIPKKYISSAVKLAVLLSLMNLNAVVYLLPIFIIEFLYL